MAQETLGRLGAENVPGLARSRPLGGGGARGFGWARRVNARWCSRGAGPVYPRGCARRAAFPARAAADVRAPGPDFLAFQAAGLGRQRLSGARARPRPPVSGARSAVGWRRRHEGARLIRAAWRGGGRAARSVRKVVGWALPVLVTSPDRRGLGPGRNRPALRPGLRPCSSARRATVLVLEERGGPRPMSGPRVGRVLPAAETELCWPAAREPPRVSSPCAVLCSGEGGCILGGPSAAPRSCRLESYSSISAIPTRHLCALRKGILFCGRCETTHARKFLFKSLNAAFSPAGVGGAYWCSVSLRARGLLRQTVVQSRTDRPEKQYFASSDSRSPAGRRFSDLPMYHWKSLFR